MRDTGQKTPQTGKLFVAHQLCLCVLQSLVACRKFGTGLPQFAQRVAQNNRADQTTARVLSAADSEIERHPAFLPLYRGLNRHSALGQAQPLQRSDHARAIFVGEKIRKTLTFKRTPGDTHDLL